MRDGGEAAGEVRQVRRAGGCGVKRLKLRNTYRLYNKKSYLQELTQVLLGHNLVVVVVVVEGFGRGAKPSALSGPNPKSRSLDGARQAAQNVHFIDAGTRKRDLGCATAATRACTTRPFVSRRRSGCGARRALCPITRVMFRDPVMVVESGHTYERSAILSHFERNGPKDPLTRLALSSTKVMTNWAVRQMVRDKHPDVTTTNPHGLS